MNEGSLEERLEKWSERQREAFEQLNAARTRYMEVLNARPDEAVRDYELKGPDGPVCLSELFGEFDELLVVHNMGAQCAYCTLWADGFNGFTAHLADRAAFVVTSPDSPEVQRRFAQKRGWEFPMVSTEGSEFTTHMGFEKEGVVRPGISAFRKTSAATIERVATDQFGPGDLYCSLWHLFDLLDGDAYQWGPSLAYG